MSGKPVDSKKAKSNVGKTSAEVQLKDGKIVRPGAWEGFNIYTAMLMVSFICIAVAIALLFFELRDWSNFPVGAFPWRTDEATIPPIVVN